MLKFPFWLRDGENKKMPLLYSVNKMALPRLTLIVTISWFGSYVYGSIYLENSPGVRIMVSKDEANDGGKLIHVIVKLNK